MKHLIPVTSHLAAAAIFDVVICASSAVRSPLSYLLLGCPQQRLKNSTPGTQGMALYVREGFSSFPQSKLECSCNESCVFRIYSRINNFYFYVFFCNSGHDGSLCDCLLTWLRCNRLMIRQSLSLLVMPMLITLSGWTALLLSLLQIDRA